MPADFDAYHKWLGIPPEEQPPHHYRLLGIKAFESDPDVIEAAADQRMAHLRNYQAGKNGPLSQKLLNEVAVALATLVDPARKAPYDQQLRARMRPAPQLAPQVHYQPMARPVPMPVQYPVQPARPPQPINAPSPPVPLPAQNPAPIVVGGSIAGRSSIGRRKAGRMPDAMIGLVKVVVGGVGGLAIAVLFVWIVARSDPFGLFKPLPDQSVTQGTKQNKAVAVERFGTMAPDPGTLPTTALPNSDQETTPETPSATTEPAPPPSGVTPPVVPPVTSPQPATTLQPVAVASPWTDLLPLIDIARDSVRGNWTIREGAVSSEPLYCAQLMLPAKVTGDYEVEVEFTCGEGDSTRGPAHVMNQASTGLVLPIGGQQVILWLHAPGGPSGLDWLEGKSAGDPNNPTHVRRQLTSKDRRHKLRAQVSRRDARYEVASWLDDGDSPLFQYTGEENAFSIWRDHRLKENGRIALCSFPATTYHAVRFRGSGELFEARPIAATPPPEVHRTVPEEIRKLDLYGGRDAKHRPQLVDLYGGNEASEAAVAAALKWLANFQLPDGGWTFDHNQASSGEGTGAGSAVEARNAATAFALLTFLGAGQTHKDGEYKSAVQRGLFYLGRTGKTVKEGLSFHEPKGTMYSHALATLAICEAQAMTGDAKLVVPARGAASYIVFSQHPSGGGWRYDPQQPGDTSVTGWQVSALHAFLHTPKLAAAHNTVQASLVRAGGFLTTVQRDGGALYGYEGPGDGLATTAVGLTARIYLGWDSNNPTLARGMAVLDRAGPDTNDMYYTYYATQAMRQYGGPEWRRWNERLRDPLIQSQVKQGVDLGSWYFPNEAKLEGLTAQYGGRLLQTALAAMLLESYYRYMPLCERGWATVATSSK